MSLEPARRIDSRAGYLRDPKDLVLAPVTLQEVECGSDDRFDVDAEVAVEIIDVAGLTEV